MVLCLYNEHFYLIYPKPIIFCCYLHSYNFVKNSIICMALPTHVYYSFHIHLLVVILLKKISNYIPAPDYKIC